MICFPEKLQYWATVNLFLKFLLKFLYITHFGTLNVIDFSLQVNFSLSKKM